MSWDQGVQERDTLPAKFVKFAEKKANSRLEYLTWYDDAYAICHFENGMQLRLVAK